MQSEFKVTVEDDDYDNDDCACVCVHVCVCVCLCVCMWNKHVLVTYCCNSLLLHTVRRPNIFLLYMVSKVVTGKQNRPFHFFPLHVSQSLPLSVSTTLVTLR